MNSDHKVPDRKIADRKIAVIGCGIIGLSTAIRLQEAGYDVTILAANLPESTVSAVAAAVWYPYHILPQDKVVSWSKTSFDRYYELSHIPAATVSFQTLIQLFRERTPDPWWIDAVENFRRAGQSELLDGFHDGWVIEIPIITSETHLGFLLDEFSRPGGKVIRQFLQDLSEINAEEFPLVVNCTGLGARNLAHDNEVYPVRGQVIRASHVTASRISYLFEDHGVATHIFVREHDLILGATADRNESDITQNEEQTRGILHRCQELVPSIESANILDVKVGLRPARHEVRLSREVVGDLQVIHNYGHGGAGYTVCWGCAEEVLNLMG